MLATILQMYTAAMAEEVRTPVPHLFGPPGCGKSTFVEQAANILGVRLHVINVSRISPLELEGVQMPMAGKLELLLATYWNQLDEGDIVLLDEFLRGFPEVYNGLLDILTSRTVAGHQLPKVFFIGASNSTTAYDAALTDRLLHLPVPDPRTKKSEHERIRATVVKALGLHPYMSDCPEMFNLLEEKVLPMYTMLDNAFGSAVTSSSSKGLSPRNLIGQAKLRHVTDMHLSSLLAVNNQLAMQEKKLQFVRLFYYKGALAIPSGTTSEWLADKMQRLLDGGRLSPDQAANVGLNVQLLNANEYLKEAL